jgi:hypothetical protein
MAGVQAVEPRSSVAAHWPDQRVADDGERTSRCGPTCSANERVFDPDPVQHLTVVHVFADQSGAAGGRRALQDERIRKRDLMKAVEIDGAEDQDEPCDG